MKYINFIDGTKARINTKLSLYVLKTAQDNNLISKKFISGLMKLALNSKEEDLNSVIDFENIDDSDLMNIAFICYSSVDGNNLDHEEFLKNVTADISELYSIYMTVLMGALDSQARKPILADNFKKATPKNNRKSKKKYRK